MWRHASSHPAVGDGKERFSAAALISASLDREIEVSLALKVHDQAGIRRQHRSWLKNLHYNSLGSSWSSQLFSGVVPSWRGALDRSLQVRTRDSQQTAADRIYRADMKLDPQVRNNTWYITVVGSSGRRPFNKGSSLMLDSRITFCIRM